MTEPRDDDVHDTPAAEPDPSTPSPAEVQAIGGVSLRTRRVGRTWRSRDESMDLGFAWVLTSLLGFGLIHFGGTSTSIVRSLLPVGVMAMYLAFGLSRQTRNLNRLADSVYFLGFLWTLFALIDTLIGRGNEVKASDVFTVFGYALVTTAAGMFFRLALVQFQRTSEDVAGEAHDEVDAHLASLIRSLRTASEGVDGLAAKLADSTVRIDNELTRLEGRFKAIDLPEDMLSKEVARIGGEMSKAAATFEQRMAESGNKVEGRITTLFDGLSRLPAQEDVDALAAQLNQSAAALTREYGELQRVVGRVGDQAASIDRDVGRVNAGFGRLAENVQVVDRSAGRIQSALTEVLAFVGKRTSGGRREDSRFTQK